MKSLLVKTLAIVIIFTSCSETDPLEDALREKTNQLSGVWVWVNTQYPTPFGAIVISTIDSGVIYKVVFSGNKAEVFRQNYLVQKFTFEVRRGSDEYFLDVTEKEELEYSTIDVLGGKILLEDGTLTLSYNTRTFRSDMLLNKLEIFN